MACPSSSVSRLYLSLGSNMGDKRANLVKARKLLSGHPDITVTDNSPIYRTAPWGEKDQDWFLNACLAIRTVLSPEKVLEQCQDIENRLGKIKIRHWGPRIIDIDLIAYDDGRKICNHHLTIPHPFALQRCFVLVPLADIAPGLILEGRTIREHLNRLDCHDLEHDTEKYEW